MLDSHDSGIEGVIVDINLLQVVMRDNTDNLIYYPNNLFIQRPVMALSEATGSEPDTGQPPETDSA